MHDPVETLARALADFAIDVLASYDVPTADCHTDPEFHEVCRETAVYLSAKITPAIIAQAVAAERDDWHGLLVDAKAEAEKAMRKFPQPNYVISKVGEEAGEVVKAAIHCAERRETAENVRGEMKQLIAMLYRLWIEGDQVHGLPPIAAAIRATSTAQGEG